MGSWKRLLYVVLFVYHSLNNRCLCKRLRTQLESIDCWKKITFRSINYRITYWMQTTELSAPSCESRICEASHTSGNELDSAHSERSRDTVSRSIRNRRDTVDPSDGFQVLTTGSLSEYSNTNSSRHSHIECHIDQRSLANITFFWDIWRKRERYLIPNDYRSTF